MFVPLEVVTLLVSGKLLGGVRRYRTSEHFKTLSLAQNIDAEIRLLSRRSLTILFMDVVGFTPLCETITAETLMVMMSEYLNAMCTIIVSSGGALDKV